MLFFYLPLWGFLSNKGVYSRRRFGQSVSVTAAQLALWSKFGWLGTITMPACESAPMAWPCSPSLEARVPSAPLAQFDRVLNQPLHQGGIELSFGRWAAKCHLERGVAVGGRGSPAQL